MPPSISDIKLFNEIYMTFNVLLLVCPVKALTALTIIMPPGFEKYVEPDNVLG
jgi:hypothetical protein